MRIAVIADDLTGACDAGVAFAPSFVVLRDPPPDGDVLVYTTDSRNDVPNVALRKVQNLLSRIPAADVVYKKIDSILRGNPAAEMAAFPAQPVLVCPAFPDQGRTVCNGVALPANVNLRALFGTEIEIPDVSSDDQLLAIAKDALSRHPRPLLVGSAGLARALARALGYALPTPNAASGSGLAILCIGSTHAVTLAQINRIPTDVPHRLYQFDLSRPLNALLALLGHEVSKLEAGGLFLCGGDTASLICNALSVRAIRLDEELEPGIPIGRLIGGPGSGLKVITKSGGFGSPDSITCAAAYLSAQTRRSV